MKRLYLAIVLLLASASAHAQKKLLDVDDLYLYGGYGSASVTRDGKHAAVIRKWIDENKTERRSLWIAGEKIEDARPMEPGEPDAESPIVSPDGRWIVFLSTRARPEGWQQTHPMPPESEEAFDLWLIPAAGGKAIPLAGPTKPYGRVFSDRFYANTSFSPDGKRLMFVADDGKDPRTAEEIAHNVRVIRDDQGEGYHGLGTARVYIAHLDARPDDHAASRIERITGDDDVWYASPQWSPDGRHVAVCANKSRDRESVRFSINKNFDVFLIDLASGRQRQLTKNPGPDVYPRFSPDGKRIVYTMSPRHSGPHTDVFNFGLVETDGEPRERVIFDHHGPRADDPPHASPSAALPEACWQDANHVLYTAAVRMQVPRLLLDTTTGKAEVVDAASMKDRHALLPTVAAEAARRKIVLPPVNTFLRDRIAAKSQVIQWKSFDGLTIDGVLTLPPPEAGAKQPYPLVVMPHGGPHYRAGPGTSFTGLVLANHGYAVLEPNFRGSTGYGKAFLDANRNDFGNGDMKDILTGADELIRQGVVDARRQFVHGVSYGGYMTAWIIGQTDRFRAAVPQNAVTDLNMMWALSDLHSWTEYEFHGYPWQQPEAYRKHSPITYVDRIKTPTLILHSEKDRRCPVAMGYAFHQALKARHVETMMVVYPDEPHGIRQPRHRADALHRVLDWFKRHDIASQSQGNR